jgi:hypothetical protein
VRPTDGARFTARTYPGAVIPSDSAVLGDEVQLAVRWDGGWEVAPPRQAPRIGDRSSALRIVRERVEGARYVVRTEGRAGQVYTLRVRAPRGAPSAVTVLPAQQAMMPLRMSDPDHDGWVNLTLEFPSQGGDADGYVALDLVFAGS